MLGEYMKKILRVYVGTYTEPILFGTGQIYQGKGKGLYRFDLDTVHNSANLIWEKIGVPNPSYLVLSPSHRYLYSVNELKELEGKKSGAVSAFSLDGENGKPRFLNSKLSLGTDPCHVVVSPRGTHVLVANYMSGSVSVFPILLDGSLDEASDFHQHSGSSINTTRQSGPHAHSTVFDPLGRYVFVSDLGADKLVVYDWDGIRGKLQLRENSCYKARAGSGPRHITHHPKKPFAYIVNELDSTISVLAYDPSSVTFREIQVLSSLPDGFTGSNSCADIHLSPSGIFLYVSNRGHDSIAVFRIGSKQGLLEPVGHFLSGGGIPRSFAIDPLGNFLLVANQNGDNIVAFRINRQTGALDATGLEIRVSTPVCIRVY
jgi:6-phosphogluconolactonase